jgi:hypothetical protein
MNFGMFKNSLTGHITHTKHNEESFKHPPSPGSHPLINK